MSWTGAGWEVSIQRDLDHSRRDLSIEWDLNHFESIISMYRILLCLLVLSKFTSETRPVPFAILHQNTLQSSTFSPENRFPIICRKGNERRLQARLALHKFRISDPCMYIFFLHVHFHSYLSNQTGKLRKRISLIPRRLYKSYRAFTVGVEHGVSPHEQLSHIRRYILSHLDTIIVIYSIHRRRRWLHYRIYKGRRSILHRISLTFFGCFFPHFTGDASSHSVTVFHEDSLKRYGDSR